jgi:hypothetical protein
MCTMIFQCDLTRPLDDWCPAGLAAMEELFFVENQPDGTSKILLITVALELSCKGPSFVLERKECRLDIVVL